MNDDDVKEFYENGHDPNWRLSNLYEIVTKEGKRVPFQPNNVQQIINKSESQRKMILKFRQVGVSTNELIKLLDWVMFNENATAAIIAHKADAIETLFQIPKLTYQLLPDKLKPKLDRGDGSKYEMFFPEINSRIYCDLEVRGGTIGRLHVSEAAFMDDSAKLKATLQAVPITTGRVTIETTPNGMANYFYDLWSDPNSIYEKFFFPWYIFDPYKIPVSQRLIYTEEELLVIEKAKAYNVNITQEQIQFRRFKKSEMKTSSFDKKRVPFEQEYPEDENSCFLASGDPVMDVFKIKALLDKSTDPIRIESGIRIYKEYDKTKTYAVGADVAEGVKKDYSTAVVIEIDSLEVAAVFRGHLKPEDFGDKLVEICEMYKAPGKAPPLLAVERNNHGHTVLYRLDLLAYPNIYHSSRDERPGWKTDQISRPIMIDSFINHVEEGLFPIPDKDILAECLTLVDNNGKIEAATGKHDDLIIACAIALQVKPDSNFSYGDIATKIHL